MIRVNLLDSVTERELSSVAAIEKKVANPKTQAMVLASVMGALLVLGLGFDYFMAAHTRSTTQEELAKQQVIAAQMAVVLKEQAELEKKTKDIEARIVAIQKLRGTQQGPVAVLSAINERLPMGNFQLQAIEQKGGEIVIKGDSPNEAAVTEFGRSLVFSSGLFTNVNIELARVPMTIPAGSNTNPAYKPETVNFTLKCRYTPPTVAPTATTPATSTAVPTATTTTPAAAPGQIAQAK